MGSVLASSAVDSGFEPRACQIKEYQIDICCFSAKQAALRRRVGSKSGYCVSGAICLSKDCFFSELALLKSN